MDLYIPALGDKLKLLEPWTFDLYHEHRNESLFKLLQIKYNPASHANGYKPGSVRVTIPAGAVLAFDRIYIRQGRNSFDSVTFLWQNSGTAKQVFGRAGTRFWAKLNDVNAIKFERVDGDTQAETEAEAKREAKKKADAEKAEAKQEAVEWVHNIIRAGGTVRIPVPVKDRKRIADLFGITLKEAAHVGITRISGGAPGQCVAVVGGTAATGVIEPSSVSYPNPWYRTSIGARAPDAHGRCRLVGPAMATHGVPKAAGKAFTLDIYEKSDLNALTQIK